MLASACRSYTAPEAVIILQKCVIISHRVFCTLLFSHQNASWQTPHVNYVRSNSLFLMAVQYMGHSHFLALYTLRTYTVLYRQHCTLAAYRGQIRGAGLLRQRAHVFLISTNKLFGKKIIHISICNLSTYPLPPHQLEFVM